MARQSKGWQSKVAPAGCFILLLSLVPAGPRADETNPATATRSDVSEPDSEPIRIEFDRFLFSSSYPEARFVLINESSETVFFTGHSSTSPMYRPESLLGAAWEHRPLWWCWRGLEQRAFLAGLRVAIDATIVDVDHPFRVTVELHDEAGRSLREVKSPAVDVSVLDDWIYVYLESGASTLEPGGSVVVASLITNVSRQALLLADYDLLEEEYYYSDPNATANDAYLEREDEQDDSAPTLIKVEPGESIRREATYVLRLLDEEEPFMGAMVSLSADYCYFGIEEQDGIAVPNGCTHSPVTQVYAEGR